MVPKVGLEPTCLAAEDFESSASTIPPLGPSPPLANLKAAVNTWRASQNVSASVIARHSLVRLMIRSTASALLHPDCSAASGQNDAKSLAILQGSAHSQSTAQVYQPN